MFSKLYIYYIDNTYSYLIHLLRGLRTAVIEERAEKFAIDFFTNYYKDDKSGIP